MKKLPFLLLFTILFLSPLIAVSQNIEDTYTALLQKKYPKDGPGVSALVAKDGKVIYRQAFGVANLELTVPMTSENVFELGSITKQFTSVAILMLIEQGKLGLDDEITKFLPEYPTHNKKITLHHLLNHTSGIKSYTGMSSFMKLAREDKSPKEVIDHFKNEPMEFDPGEKWNYNNSGYIILGYIIEQVSGKTYEEFISENIFVPLEMKNSHYGSKTKLIPNRASGYMPIEDGYRNADYLSMSLPYAAGSLMSTVDDMLLWHKAVRDDVLISSQSKALAFKNSTLNNGEATNYGYGWQMNEINGVASIEHGGGIFGYVTQGVYVPSEDVYVILLTNSNGVSPQEVAVKMAAQAFENPFPTESMAVSLNTEQLEKWIGKYDFGDDVIRTLSVENDVMYSQRDGSEKLKLFAIADNKFVFEGGITQYQFGMENGKKIAQFSNRIQKSKGTETDKKLASEKEAIEIDPKILTDYLGEYALQPQFIITVTTKNNQLFAQATGQPQFEVFPEAEDVFFLKVVPAKLVFARDSNGKVTDVTLHQGGQEMKGNRKE